MAVNNTDEYVREYAEFSIRSLPFSSLDRMHMRPSYLNIEG